MMSPLYYIYGRHHTYDLIDKKYDFYFTGFCLIYYPVGRRSDVSLIIAGPRSAIGRAPDS